MTNLFKIGSTDLTPWEDTQKHNVNRVDIFEEWTDGNWTTHRVIARTQISGTVVLNFAKETEYSNVLSLLQTSRNANGYYAISVYCSNTGTLETINAFLDYVGETAFDVTAPIKHQRITVTITGR